MKKGSEESFFFIERVRLSIKAANKKPFAFLLC